MADIEKQLLRLEYLRDLVTYYDDFLQERAAGEDVKTRLWQVNDCRSHLGFATMKPGADIPTASDVELGEPRPDTSHLYSVRAKGESRQRLNDEAVALIHKIDQEGMPAGGLTDEQKRMLAKFSGYGGNLEFKDPVTGKVEKGSAYEYFTPKPIAEGVWDVLANQLGFAGGRVLDPSAGTGIFGATAPQSCAIDSVELSHWSGRVNQLVNDGPGYKTHICPFERFAAGTPDEVYDAVVTNVPFGTNADRGNNSRLDPKYQKESLQTYFILRSLEKLKPNGMAAFICPTSVLDGKGEREIWLRQQTSLIAEFRGAYRLPSGTFSTANTQTMTDVLFFRKFSEETAQAIQALYANNPDVLRESLVIWDRYEDGHYFDTPEGKRLMIGEEAEIRGNFGSVKKGVVGSDLAKISADLRGETGKTLPKSRIKWDLLELEESAPAAPKEGDIIVQAGQTLRYSGGEWRPVSNAPNEVSDILDRLSQLPDPFAAWSGKVEFGEIERLYENARNQMILDIPEWIGLVVSAIRTECAEKSLTPTRWKQIRLALAVDQVVSESNGKRRNYQEAFPELSAELETAKIRTSAAKKSVGVVAIALRTAARMYVVGQGFSDEWLGKGEDDVGQSEAATQFQNTEEGKIAALRYRTKTQWLRVEDLKRILGDDFDPIAREDWCISADGKTAIPADDYYIGNYAEFLKQIDEQIDAATDPLIKAKLITQKRQAELRITRIDVDRLEFNLRSPFLLPEEKLRFLRRFCSEYAEVVGEGEDRYVTIKVPDPNVDGKILNRVGYYIQSGRVSAGGYKYSEKEEDEERARNEAVQAVQAKVNRLNVQINDWVHAQPDIMERIRQQAEDPSNLRFDMVEDGSDISIPGMKPTLKLHDYQAAFVRRMGRSFGGINGFGTGLGKTFTALASVQHAQNIGVKKKTVFVVPNSTFSNWKKEAETAYTDDELKRCLFVGLRFDEKLQKAVVKSSAYDDDLNVIKLNRHSKIFMTAETFERIRLKDETLAAYENDLRVNEEGYRDTGEKSVNEVKKAKLARVISAIEAHEKKKSAGSPFWEDLGIDSVVLDEAHIFKNSVPAIGFKQAKFLPLTEPSGRGLDAQVKAWYTRGGTACCCLRLLL